VYATAVSGNALYIGGAFTYVGPNTGPAVVLDPVTGVLIQPNPSIQGSVTKMIPDGASGWYIAGSFSSVGGQPRANLAHILADNSVSDWPIPPGARWRGSRTGEASAPARTS
jgi:hypothetical protein